ncbi:TetR/AcrR family transcriptional regulator [Corallococcus sp. H22C18031201]|uniref:TetR/AcrR family transcriptional regulator n=1 Tax=Citreicoccus inhibens TaxID=2849499 RepID=UPI000E71E65A|nr:TetR/AcrR family transcriptional regulator [Citreicoccus inhibens]MBU8898680.1 TetR/AcrR family transcriptional regulator [Citreicoccus inhibens]RJS15955.1 TetR/AcrR family transcriptional regulator [Corallococcus sp. H22C18031201]
MNPDSKSEAPVQKLRSRIKEATAEAILKAAAEVFVDQGLHSARMESIAERAGVSVGTLYNHFADRAALLEALRTQRRQWLFDRLDETLESLKGQPFQTQLRALVDALFAHVCNKDAFARLLMQQHEAVVRNASYAETLAELHRRMEEVLDVGIRAGEVRPEGRAFYPTLLMGMVRSVMQRREELGAEEILGIWADEVVRLFLKGIEV